MPDKRVTELTAIDAVADLDLLMVIDDPAGTAVNKKATVTQLLATAARTNASNTFTGDQTVDGDLFVTGEVNPTFFAAQLRKIDLFTETPVGDPSGSRTVMSRSLVSGLSIRHDEALAEGRLSVGNYDTQLYQPLKVEVESFQVHTGVSPGVRMERLRVHPSGGVTVGMNHVNDPGGGSLAADAIDLKEGIPLDPPTSHTGRLYALDVNGYTQVEMRDANAKVVRLASDNILIAKVTGAPITRGQCLYLAGASGANPLVGLARSDDLATMPAVGLALDAGSVNAFVRVLLLGTFQLLNTSAFAEGDRLYVSPTTAGALTTTRPAAPAYAQRVGIVTRSHATQGEMVLLTTAVEGDPRLHHATHEPGGSDALTNLDAGILTGTVPDARLSSNVALRGFRNTFTQVQTIAPPPNEPGLLVIRDSSGQGAILNFSDDTAPTDRHTFYMKSQGGGFSIMQADDVGANLSAVQWFKGSLYMYAGIHSEYPHGLLFGSSTSIQPADPCVFATSDTLELKRYDDTDRITLLAKGFGNTPLDASQLVSGTMPLARVAVSAGAKLLGRGASGAGAMEEITLGTGLTMSGTTLNAEGGSTLPPTVAYTDVANVFTQMQTFTSPYPQILLNSVTPLIQWQPTGGVVDGRRWDTYADGQGALVFQSTNDAGTVMEAVPLKLYRVGNVSVGGSLFVGSGAGNVALTTAANVFTQNQRIQKAGYTALELRDTTSAVDGRDWHIGASGGILKISHYSDAGVEQANAVSFFRAGGNTEWYGPVTYYENATYYGVMQVSGANPGLKFGGATAAYPALRKQTSGGATLEVVSADTPSSVYVPVRAASFISSIAGSSLADLTVTGATNFAGGMSGTAIYTSGTGNSMGDLTCRGGMAIGSTVNFPVSTWLISSEGYQRLHFGSSGPTYVKGNGINFWNLSDTQIASLDNTGLFTCAGSIGTPTNTWRSNIHPSGYVYPAAITNPGVVQSSWYLGSHSSYGLYCNTGLYVVGDVWAGGSSLLTLIGGKMNNLVQTHGAISLTYGTQSAFHNLLTQVAAPAGGTGTAAGGWSTAANRDLAIASINAARTDIINIKQLITFLVSALKGNGVLPT